MGKYPILMGDVISSRNYEAAALHEQLSSMVEHVNSEYSGDHLSPYTITLGDEFQGISRTMGTAAETLFRFEEYRLEKQLTFKLHYVLCYGRIDTEINPEIAYEMMGPGLTAARELLGSKKRDRKRFQFRGRTETESVQLERLFIVINSIISSWKEEDFPLILDMIREENNAEVGKRHDKNRDQIWKRRKTLMINEYNALKEFVITYTK